MADPLEQWVSQYCAGGKKAEAAEEQLHELFAGTEAERRDHAASLLLERVERGQPPERARALQLLHTAWWPPGSRALSARAVGLVLSLAPRFNRESNEWEDGAALLGNLVRAEPAHLSHLDAALSDANPSVRGLAAAASGRIGFGAASLVPRLGALLADADETVGDAALESLSALAPHAPLQGLPPLLTELTRAEGMRRYLTLVAVRAILEAHAHGEQLPPEALTGVDEAVLPVLKDPEPAIRVQAVAVLGAAGGGYTAELEPFLSDPSAAVAATAAVALAKLGPPPDAALKVLERLLRDADPETHHSALSAVEGAEAATIERLRPTLEPLTTLPHLGDGLSALLSGAV